MLADDLDGNGRLDLVLATMNGNVYALETPAEFHPLKAWPSQVCTRGQNVEKCGRRGTTGTHPAGGGGRLCLQGELNAGCLGLRLADASHIFAFTLPHFLHAMHR